MKISVRSFSIEFSNGVHIVTLHAKDILRAVTTSWHNNSFATIYVEVDVEDEIYVDRSIVVLHETYQFEIPEGKCLAYIGTTKENGDAYHFYELIDK
jgi:hypothetical protein